jgi:glycosyltransferase involved in cell wall biosynthesis
MKVLLVNDYSHLTGGAEVLISSLRDTLRQRGHDARLFTSSAKTTGVEGGADYQCLGTSGPFRTLLQSANPWAARRLREVLHEFRPDVVHVTLFLTQLSPLILPLLRGVPSVYYVVWHRAVCPLGTKLLPDGSPCRTLPGAGCLRGGCLPLRDWSPLMAQRALWLRWRGVFDTVVACSEGVRDSLRADGIEPAAVIDCGVPVTAPRPPLAWPPTAAFAGRLVREKGVDVLLRAFARAMERIPEARLVLLGDGPEGVALRGLAGELGISGAVSWTGHVSRLEMERRLGRAWVQAIPSRWAEPFGLVATEAMMRGTAVVASGAGGLADIVRPGRTGLLVPAGDPEALAEALVALLADRDRAEAMGRAGREVALAEYSTGRFTDRFERLYGSLCRKERRVATYA